MFLTDSKRHILVELHHGPLNIYQVSEASGIPPFTVRAELKDLKRDGLVIEHLTRDRHDWELSNRGHAMVYSSLQLELRGWTGA